MRSALMTLGFCVLIGSLALSVSHTKAEEGAVTAQRMWEYKLVNLLKLAGSSADESEIGAKIETELNNLGADGWEVSQSLHNALILKRPK